MRKKSSRPGGKRPLIISLVLLALAGGAISGCTPSHAVEMAPLDHMAHEVQQMPQRVQEAYQFAIANPDVAREIPCYCNCGPLGHTSSYDCYVAGVDDNGEIIYDWHALGCQICIDITQDTMRLMQQNKSTQQIYDFVEARYSSSGPSNMP